MILLSDKYTLFVINKRGLKMIYLDNAATSFPKPECVYAAADRAQRTLAVNAGRGTYRAAREASAVIESARRRMAELTGCQDSSRVVFSPSATIAMNQVIGGLSWSSGSNVYVSPFEHNAAVRPLKSMADRYGFSLKMLPFDGKTQALDEAKMRSMFALSHPDAVFACHMSNVTGLVLPVQKIFDAAKEYGAVTVMDASQSLGAADIDLRQIKADFSVFAGHKNLYGNFGIGGFISGGCVPLKKFLFGGTGSDSLNPDMPQGMPSGYEPASHDVIAAAALDSALKWLMDTGTENIRRHKKELADHAAERLGAIRNIRLYLPEDRNCHTSVISLMHKEYSPSELADILDAEFDIAVRSGYHCAPFVHKLIGTEDTHGTVRVSFGYFNDKSDIDALISALEEI